MTRSDQSSESTSGSTPENVSQADDLAQDIVKIVQQSKLKAASQMVLTGNPDQTGTFENALITQLCIYIVNRDYKVLDHGIKLGKDQQK